MLLVNCDVLHNSVVQYIFGPPYMLFSAYTLCKSLYLFSQCVDAYCERHTYTLLGMLTDAGRVILAISGVTMRRWMTV